jgi:hypothetical protein
MKEEQERNREQNATGPERKLLVPHDRLGEILQSQAIGAVHHHTEGEDTKMSKSTKTHRRSLGVFAAVLAAIVLPLGLVAPAQAATIGGCTAVPLKPQFVGFDTPRPTKLVSYPVSVSCQFLRKIEVRERFYEIDAPTNSYQTQGSTTLTWSFVTDGSRTLRGANRLLLDTDLPGPSESGAEEIAHKISFRVWTNADTAVTAWTAWENSSQLSIYN